jgi:branched-chain amino acid aminotransferase
VRPAKAYKFLVIASPAGNYFKSGAPAVSIWVSDYTRAAPGGTGAAKCGGNYAASLVPTAEAFARATIRCCSLMRPSTSGSRNWAA